MAEGELFRIFSRFPSQKHVIEICKMGQGKETCRYLTVGSSWECLKTNCSLKKQVDKRLESNEIIPKGNNCEGLLGLIVKNQEKLRGKKADYVRLYFTMTSKFKKIEIEEIKDNRLKVLRLTMYWKNKKGREEGKEFEFDINNLNIEVNSESIILFQNLNLNESFVKQFIIFF